MSKKKTKQKTAKVRSSGKTYQKPASASIKKKASDSVSNTAAPASKQNDRNKSIHSVSSAISAAAASKTSKTAETAKPAEEIKTIQSKPDIHATKTADVQTKKKKKKKRPIILWILAALLCIAAIGGLSLFCYYEYLIQDVQPLDLSRKNDYSTASVIYDSKDQVVAEYGSNENIEWADIEDIPQTLKDAFVSIEDKRFYTHPGIDVKRLIGAGIGQLTGNASYGASTITQQLVKNTYLSSEKTYKRKAQEIHLSLELEQKMTKDEILEWYLNIIYLGDSNYGVKVAAKDYFGKDLDELSLRECAMIAGLVQSPNSYNPRTSANSGDMTLVNNRTDTVLYAMYTNEKITEEQYHEALNDDVYVLPVSTRFSLYDYPIYVEYAVENVAEKMLENEGLETTDENVDAKKQEIRESGYQIHTALHTDQQDTMQTAITEFSNYPRSVNGEEVQASSVIIDQHTGEVTAMVSGREEPTEPEGYNRAVDSTQAVGSSMKPLSVYAPALETGDYPGTTVRDVQEEIIGYGTDNSFPNGANIDGPITMRRALELSHNIPACRFLLEHIGLERSYDFLLAEGFDSAHLSETAAGLALGASDVTTLEMTAAYAALANGGVYIEPHAYRTVYDRHGNTVLDSSSIETHRVFSESTAWLVTDMMETNMTAGLGVNARLTDMICAGKTGTHEHKAISFGGYTPYYTSFLRISNDSYVDMINSSSYYQASPLWKSYMNPIHAGLANKDIQEKTADELGIRKYHVCTNSGMLANEDCPSDWEYAAPDNAPTEYCTGHTYGKEGEIDYENGWWDEDGVFHENPEDYTNGWWDEAGVFHENE